MLLPRVAPDETDRPGEDVTEAMAATAVAMDVSGSGDPITPIVIKLDRPFLFVLTVVPTGATLFLGQVADPSAG